MGKITFSNISIPNSNLTHISAKTIYYLQHTKGAFGRAYLNL